MIKLLNLPANTAFDFDHSFEEHLIKIGYRDLNAEDLVLEFEAAFQIDPKVMAPDKDVLFRVCQRFEWREGPDRAEGSFIPGRDGYGP
jgi:hypothetical protein